MRSGASENKKDERGEQEDLGAPYFDQRLSIRTSERGEGWCVMSVDGCIASPPFPGWEFRACNCENG